MKQLHDYQLAAVERSLAERRHILNFEMRVGKTPTAIETARKSGATSALIVCPAMVRRHWVHEFNEWWPDNPGVGEIIYGPTAKLSKPKTAERERAYIAPIKVVSYAAMKHAVELHSYDAIVFDEGHYLGGFNKRKEVAFDLVNRYSPTALVQHLTGTLMPNSPEQFWHQATVLWPGRFGKLMEYRQRYMLCEQNSGNFDVWRGLNPGMAEELRERIAGVSSRVTRRDIAHLIPPMDVRPLRVRGKHMRLAGAANEADVSRRLAAIALDKVDRMVEWAAMQPPGPMAVMVYHKHVAEMVGLKLRDKGYNVAVISGDLPTAKRLAALEVAKQAGATLVATMPSVGIGIDLSTFGNVLFAELAYRPETVLQAMSRFSLHGGIVSPAITVLLTEGGIDERVWLMLREKIKTINTAVRAGESGAAVEDVLNKNPDWAKRLAAAIGEEEVDEFGV